MMTKTTNTPMATTTTTSIESEDQTMVDIKLFKAIFLHQMLDTNRGRNWFRTVFQATLWVAFSVQIVQLVGLYSAFNDLQRFAFTTMTMSNGLLGVFKGYVVVANVDKLRACLEAAHFGFTSCGARDQRTVRRTQAVLSTLLRTFTVLSWITGVLWVLGPLLKAGAFLSVTNVDGSVSHYRTNIYNVWVPVSESVYNWLPVWAVLYAVEVVVCCNDVFSWVLFDCYVVTLCYTFNAQFRTVSDSSAAIGHRDRFESPPPYASGTHRRASYNSTLHSHDELMSHLQDTQNVMKKYDDFFDVIGPVILFQIVAGSYLVINLVFLSLMTYLMGGAIMSEPFMKMFFGFLSVICELFLYCYIFNHIENEKVLVNFGLYSCNWTEMDLKFKKTMLLAMHMNSAHRRVMKVTPNSILNLEMFTNVMNFSYTMVSVLLNSRA